jgi:hypothetical protein
MGMLAAYVLFVDAVRLQKFLVRVHCVFSSKRSGEHHAATLLSVLDTRQIVPHDCCDEKALRRGALVWAPRCRRDGFLVIVPPNR